MPIDKPNTVIAFNNFTAFVIKQAQINLAKEKKNASGALSKSFKSDVKVMPNSIKVSIESQEYQDYGIFIDQGVSGIKKKYTTPFAYKNKRPSTRYFDRWSVKRGIAPRDKKGKFVSRKSLGFALASKIYNYGIRPTRFFNAAFEKGFDQLGEDIIIAYGLDVESFLKHTFNGK